MAKRQRNQQVTAAFNYLVKSRQDESDPDNVIEEGFTLEEFQRLLNRIEDTQPLNEGDQDVIKSIKAGVDLPFSYYEEVERGLYFGDFDGAYYGQRYRNNRLGIVEASDLNLRRFHYLVTRLRDGKILIGTSYHGLYGDYDGLRSCFSHLLRGNHKIASKTLKSISAEIGGGKPVSLKVTYRKIADRPERRPLFGSSGAIAISSTDFGNGFADQVTETAKRVRGDIDQRKRVLAQIISEDHMISLNEDDILGCSAVVRENGRQRTVYFLGDNNFSTKFLLTAGVDQHGVTERSAVKNEMIRVMRENIMPLMR